MKTNDIKKGMRILLNNGWEGTMWDNMRGNTRVAEVEGYFTEAGSVYSHDIVACKPNPDTDEVWTPVEHTKAQLKLRKQVDDMF
jgi:hypothetical protein